MCGRFALTATPSQVEQLFDIAGLEPFPPRYNIAPTQPICIVRTFPSVRQGALVRWGLVPHWVKDPGSFSLLINGRSETALEKPAFRTAMRHRRCLVPVSGFYEWQRGANRKQPYWIAPSDQPVFALAGLWETWMGKDGSEIDTAAILTTGANARLSAIHHRMPVVIARDDFARWLDPCVEPRHVADLFRPAPDAYFSPVPVGERVNSARNDGPDLQQPIRADAVADGGRNAVPQKGRTEASKRSKPPADGQMDLF